MKILYGIQGTGNGHLTRSVKMIESLRGAGHEVDVLMSGTYANIAPGLEVKYTPKGFTFKHHKDGSINYVKTFFSLDFKRFIKDSRIDLAEYDRVISDYEPVTAWAGKWQDKEVVGISNQASFLSPKTPRPRHKDPLAELVMTSFAPVGRAIGLHFEAYDDFIHKPVIRDEVIGMKLEDLGHYTVYLPNMPVDDILKQIKRTARDDRFEIFSNTVKKDEAQGNALLRKTDSDAFLESFRTSRGVITRAGFQTTAEALYTGKKLMAIPLPKQYEQTCNAVALQELGVFIGELKELAAYLAADAPEPAPWDDPVDAILTRALEG